MDVSRHREPTGECCNQIPCIIKNLPVQLVRTLGLMSVIRAFGQMSTGTFVGQKLWLLRICI